MDWLQVPVTLRELYHFGENPDRKTLVLIAQFLQKVCWLSRYYTGSHWLTLAHCLTGSLCYWLTVLLTVSLWLTLCLTLAHSLSHCLTLAHSLSHCLTGSLWLTLAHWLTLAD